MNSKKCMLGIALLGVFSQPLLAMRNVPAQNSIVNAPPQLLSYLEEIEQYSAKISDGRPLHPDTLATMVHLGINNSNPLARVYALDFCCVLVRYDRDLDIAVEMMQRGVNDQDSAVRVAALLLCDALIRKEYPSDLAKPIVLQGLKDDDLLVRLTALGVYNTLDEQGELRIEKEQLMASFRESAGLTGVSLDEYHDALVYSIQDRQRTTAKTLEPMGLSLTNPPFGCYEQEYEEEYCDDDPYSNFVHHPIDTVPYYNPLPAWLEPYQINVPRPPCPGPHMPGVFSTHEQAHEQYMRMMAAQRVNLMMGHSNDPTDAC